jgi:Domain of unknown function (DUF4265)
MSSTINLQVGTNRDGSPFYESILVDVLGENRYRVAASPGLAEGMAAGDEIELAPDERLGYRILKRGGNVSIQFFWHDGDIKRCLRDMEPKAIALGGCIDGETPGLLVFTIPVTAGFPAIEKIFYDAEKQYPGSTWMYGNVYDPEDPSKQLYWWAKK